MTNVGTFDRAVRLAAGVLLIALSLLPPSAPFLAGLGAWRWAAVAAGAVLIITAAVRFCPAYVLGGLNTCPRK